MINQTFSHYRVLERLGSGGMGVVYKAQDTRLDRFVALKFLPNHLARDPQSLERFRREARAASALNHPNICTVYDIGEDGNEQFIAMEFLDGKPLKRCIEGRALPFEKLLDWAIQIAEGLNAAHSLGIIHRDIKTANIFITKHGHAKVLDFGLAKLAAVPDIADDSGMATVTSGALLTSPGAAVGTVAYMSPEQARGEELDARSDLFSFGAVIYELATGRLPFPGSTPALIFEAILNKTPISPTTLISGLPPDLERVIGKALEKDREVRYQSTAELRADLKRIRRDTTSGQSRAYAPEQTTPKRRTLFHAAVALALIALLTLAIFLFRERTSSALVPSSEWVQLTDFVDSATSPALSPDGRFLTFLRGSETFVTAGDVYVKLLPGGAPVQLTHDGTNKMSPVFSPDGSQVAYTSSPGHWDTWIAPVLGGDPRLMLPNASGLTWIGAHRLLFSEIKAGRHMVIVTSTDDRSAERNVFPPPGEGSMAHRSYISPDGKWVLVVWMVTGGGWQPCRLVSFDGHEPGKQIGPPGGRCTAAAWSPDGRWMYFSSSARGGFHTWRQRFPSGEPEQVTAGVTEEEGIAMAPDGRWLVTSVGTRQSSLWIHDLGGDHQLTSEGAVYLSEPDTSSSGAALSPDGKRVYYLRQDEDPDARELWSLEIASGRGERAVTGLSGAGFDVSPDGRDVAYSVRGGDGRESIWLASLDHHSPPRQIPSTTSDFAPAFGPDGTLFFMAAEGEKAFVHHMNRDGSERRKLIKDPIVQMETVSPDGQWVVAQVAFPDEDPPRGIVAERVAGSGRVRLCRGVCGVHWSLDGKAMFISLPGTSHGEGIPWGTFVAPLSSEKLFPKLPPMGISSANEAAAIPGAKKLEKFAVPGIDRDTFLFNRITVHRNLFRIPLH